VRTIGAPTGAPTRTSISEDHAFLVAPEIVGGWTDDPGCSECFTKAFLLTPRGFESLEFPGALETVADGINAAGEIVGEYFGEDEVFHGFLRDHDGE
jgi:hypothetical protein